MSAAEARAGHCCWAASPSADCTEALLNARWYAYELSRQRYRWWHCGHGYRCRHYCHHHCRHHCRSRCDRGRGRGRGHHADGRLLVVAAWRPYWWWWWWWWHANARHRRSHRCCLLLAQYRSRHDDGDDGCHSIALSSRCRLQWPVFVCACRDSAKAS